MGRHRFLARPALRGERLDEWIDAAAVGGIAEVGRFALGLHGDASAVHAGLTRAESNGQAEGQIKP